MTPEAFRAAMRDALSEAAPEAARDDDTLSRFLARLDYVTVDADRRGGLARAGDGKLRPDAVRAFYLSVAPSLFGPIAERLSRSHGIATPEARIVVEKPFGHDLHTARRPERRACAAASPSTRSTASTITSARRRCRT